MCCVSSERPRADKPVCTQNIRQGFYQESFDLALRQGIKIFNELGQEFSSYHSRLNSLRHRLAQNSIHIAILGQFKRGKSTFLNALLGEPILPMSVLPLTSIPTFVQASPFRKVRIVFLDEKKTALEFNTLSPDELRSILTEWVTESGNPGNVRNVSQVEVFHPAPVLRNGVVFIDTPGIGSTLRHNTETTLNFLSHCDAAVFLVSADPPVTEVEVEFLRRVRSKIEQLFFVINKTDYLTDREKQLMISFLNKVLKEQTDSEIDIRIFPVSASEGLIARQTENPDMWKKSGMSDVEEYLIQFLINEKATALASALSRKASDILAEAITRLELNLKSLQMPLKQLEQKLDVFERKLAEINNQRQEIKDLLAGDQKRLHACLEEYSKQLHAQARLYLDGVIKEISAEDGNNILSESTLQEKLANHISGFFERSMGEAATLFDNKVLATLERHQQRIDQLIESIRQTAANLFNVPHYTYQSHEKFTIIRKPYWVTHQWATSLQPFSRRTMDKLLPQKSRNIRILKHLQEQVDFLVLQNVEGLRWSIFQSMDHAFARFNLLVDERLNQAIDATHHAIKAAMRQRKEHSEHVSEMASKWRASIEKIQSVQKNISIQ
jgi:GTPase Era involved in 16S rRNA processing